MADPIATDSRVPRYLDYPYSVGGNGIPSTTTADDHLRDLILQVLFTNSGERVNLPEFGAGLQRLIFETVERRFPGQRSVPGQYEFAALARRSDRHRAGPGNQRARIRRNDHD